MTDVRLFRVVVADVRSAVPGATRERMAAALRRHFDDEALIEDELDRSFGCLPGAYG